MADRASQDRVYLWETAAWLQRQSSFPHSLSLWSKSRAVPEDAALQQHLLGRRVNSASPVSFIPGPSRVYPVGSNSSADPWSQREKAINSQGQSRKADWGTGERWKHSSCFSFSHSIDVCEEGGQEAHWELPLLVNSSSERFCLSCFWRVSLFHRNQRTKEKGKRHSGK